MNRLFAVAVVFALPGLVRADVGVPGFNIVRHEHTFEPDREYPDHAFFLVAYGRVQPLALKAGQPLRVSPEGWHGPYRTAAVIAVPRPLLAELNGVDPTWDWLEKHKGLVMRSEVVSFRGDLPMWDNRDRIATTHRVRVEADRIVLETTAENAGSPWVKGAWAVAGVALLLGIALFGLWVGRKILSTRKPAAGPRPAA